MERTFTKEINGLFKKRGGIKQVLRDYGIITLIDLGLRFLHLKLVSRFYRMRKNNYGLNEAFYYPRGIEEWSRYADVVGEIYRLEKVIIGRGVDTIPSKEESILKEPKALEKARNKKLTRSTGHLKVLEIGSGRGVLRFLSTSRYNLILIDISRNAFLGVRNKNVVVCDGCNLPFRNAVFDFVISTATLEHIPKKSRHNFLSESDRVCRKVIIFHFPSDSGDGQFRGSEYDKKFQMKHKKLFGFEDLPTRVHIASGHPTIEEVRKTLPTSRIVGRKNCEIWLKYMIFERMPLIGFLAGLTYYIYWKKKDNKPPYYEGMLIYEK